MSTATKAAPARVLRRVGDAEYEAALADGHNRAILHRFTRLYCPQADDDERWTLALQALWRCLQYHVEGAGRAFTTNLVEHVRWVCGKYRRRLGTLKHRPLPQEDDLEARPKTQPLSERKQLQVAYVRECMRHMSTEQRAIVQLKFFDNATAEEIGVKFGWSKEASRQKYEKAMARLRELCCDPETGFHVEEDD